MTTNHESKGPALLFLGAWWALSQYAPLADYAFITAIGLMAILWIAVKFAGRAVFRLGRDGWFLIAQVAAWFGVSFWFFPAEAVPKIVLLWGIGIPLLFVGAGVRAFANADVATAGTRFTTTRAGEAGRAACQGVGLELLVIVTGIATACQSPG